MSPTPPNEYWFGQITQLKRAVSLLESRVESQELDLRKLQEQRGEVQCDASAGDPDSSLRETVALLEGRSRSHSSCLTGLLETVGALRGALAQRQRTQSDFERLDRRVAELQAELRARPLGLSQQVLKFFGL